MELTEIPIRSPDFRLELTENDIVLYRSADAGMIFINQPAALIWELCDGQRSAGEIIDLLCAAYPDEVAEIPDDVLATLENLRSQGCLEFV